MEFVTKYLSVAPSWAILSLLATVVVHIAFSAAVFNDASHLKDEQQRLMLVGPTIWALAVLIGGVFVGVAYWLIHHSTLSKH